MTVRRIDSVDAFLSLREPWNELCRNSDAEHAFMRHEWFEIWRERIGSRGRLAIVTSWADGQLVAVAPLHVTRQRLKHIPVRALGFLSSGIAPRCGVLAREPGDVDVLVREMLAARHHDVLLLRNVPVETESSRRLLRGLAAGRHGLFHLEQTGRRSPFIRCEGSWDDYWRSLSKSLRQSVRTAVNRMKRDGNETHIRRVDEPDELLGLFDTLVEISRRSWKGGSSSDLASRPELQDLYRDFSRRAPAHWEAWVLEVNGVVAAFDYYLKGPHAVSLIRTDFDPEWEFFSPGNHLRVAALQDLFAREGVWEYDMGGQAYAYKMRWTENVREHRHVVAAGSTLRGRLLLGLWHAQGAVRRQADD